MRMRGRFAHGQYRRETHVSAFQLRAPLVSRLAPEGIRQRTAHFRPLSRIVLAVGKLSRQTESFDQLAKERRLQRSDGDVPTIAGLVCVIEGRTAVEPVGAALVAPLRSEA